MIHSSQEAELEIHCTAADEDLLKGTLNNAAAQWLIVSKVSFAAGDKRQVVVKKAPGTKCPRCWNYTEEADSEGLCPRCHRVMNK